MQIARLTSNGQITIPEQIRKKLNLKTGDKIAFVEKNNDVSIMNSSAAISIAALKKLQLAMEGEAEKAGIMNEDDVIALCAEVRRELYKKYYEDND